MFAQTTQPRSRPVLVEELRKMAGKSSEDFWVWWWMLSKAERLELLNVMEPQGAK